MSVAGRYFDARSSRPQDAELTADVGGGLLLRFTGGERRFRAGDFEVSDRILDLPRRVGFAGGAVFETRDNDGVDALIAAVHPGPGRRARAVYALERAWPAALGSVVAVAFIAFAFLRWGVPAMAGIAARVLPASVDRVIGGESLGILDRTVFAPSGLSPQRKLQLQQMFTRITADLHDGHEYRLEMRSSPRIGPNALALPSGIVVITDQLVQLAPQDPINQDSANPANAAQTDEELLAVLAHEVGHVRGRHALRLLFQAAGVSVIAAAILGDVSSVVGIAATAPLLLQAKQSRDFEREADAFARSWLSAHGIPQQRFDTMLCRLARQSKHRDGPGDYEYLSTHPPVRERVKCPAP